MSSTSKRVGALAVLLLSLWGAGCGDDGVLSLSTGPNPAYHKRPALAKEQAPDGGAPDGGH